jgi:hypothetical protein
LYPRVKNAKEGNINRKLNEVQRGWVNYFRMASIHGKLKGHYYCLEKVEKEGLPVYP